MANAPFEGEIVVSVKDEAAMKLPASITYDVKGNKVRYVPAAAPVYALGDMDGQQAYAVDDAKKTYDAIDVKPARMRRLRPSRRCRKRERPRKSQGSTARTGRLTTATRRSMSARPRESRTSILASDAKAGSAETPWAVALTTQKAFPLRVVVHDKMGKEEYRAEATRADRKKLDDALFHPPSAYKAASLAKETKTASLP